MFIGSFIIFTTFATLNGMEKTISDNINMFNYQYYSYSNNINEKTYENSGNEKIKVYYKIEINIRGKT